MKKLSLIPTLLLLAAAFSFPQTVFAATVPYQSITTDMDGVVREKVGSHYIWTRAMVNSRGIKTGSKLLLSKDGKTIKTLRSFKGKTKGISQVVITNGSMIYKATYTGKKHVEITSAKHF